MNMDTQSADALVKALADGYSSEVSQVLDLAVCPAFVYVSRVVGAFEGTSIAVGAQDCSDKEQGAYTGQVAASMLRDIGCTYVIVGHSERRQYNDESSELVCQKASQAIEHGLVPIICVGETAEEREAGKDEDIVGAQLVGSIPQGSSADNMVIAYEPVWAIGTGKTATPEDVQAMHAFIREKLSDGLADSQNVRILYGGSMKPENAADLLSTPNVDGGLIGGASLEADKFLAIARAAL